MKSKKQAIILSVIASIVLLVLIVGATYAYFQASGGKGTSANLRVTTYTTDVFNFEVGSDISIYADATSFASGKGNAVGSTFAKAILTANNKTNTATEHYYLYLNISNNKTNTATEHYYLYLNISNNTFLYTQNESTPELLLTITDASGNAVTDITSLTYKTVTDGKGASISGYDITNKSGLITLFNNKEITASPTKTDEWNITVTLVNYDKDQSENAGKSFSAKLMIQKGKIKETVATVCSNGQTLSSCIISMDGKDDTLYHHTSSLANGAGDNSYRYAGASDQVNNFVCFGSTTKPCPTDNLYRIIGVFGENNHGVTGKQLVKLIKYDYATSALLGTDGDYQGSWTPDASTYKGSLTKINTYFWNYKNDTSINNGYGSNTWSTSLLNKTNLNSNFINNLGSIWANKIATTTWKVGGNTYSKILKVGQKITYQNEIVIPDPANSTDNLTEYNAKIGLMYASDYGFAASPGAWTTTLYYYSGSVNGATIKSQNWMQIGYYDWTISRSSDYTDEIFNVLSDGSVNSGNPNGNRGVRPSFNLESTVSYVSGSGTQSDPIRII